LGHGPPSVDAGIKSNRRRMPGGILPIEWGNGEVVLTGRADLVYNGDWLGADNLASLITEDSFSCHTLNFPSVFLD
jgi:hypothetical protein